MKIVCQYLLTLVLLFSTTIVFAQDVNVSGIVLSEKGDTLKGATVFIGESERAMATDENGRFNFAHVPPGAFKLSAQMIGYGPLTRNIVVKNIPLVLEMRMKAKVINLGQVDIGHAATREKYLNLFKEKFLGKSANGKQCEIVNPSIINFSTVQGHLLADADDFLVIENKRLGYRINYLLQGFDYNRVTGIVVYHGECSFKELNGTDAEQKKWVKNRIETYKGSFTHFLRSVYANNTVENGFITRPMFDFETIKYGATTLRLPDRLIVKNSPVNFDSLVTAIDTGFVSFTFKQLLYVMYDPKKAARFASGSSEQVGIMQRAEKGSILKLTNAQAIIDQKGSYTDYRDLLVQGYWADDRIGDQLPVEYKPPMPDLPRKNIPGNSVLASLQQWADSIPQEKAYLQMDKPYYALGDTIWFKGYLTTGSRHRLSAISGAAYVQLIDDQNKAIKTLKLPADSGTVAGNIILNEDFKAGNYRIRAYTQWMRNAGESYFFDHAFTIGDPRSSKPQKAASTSSQPTDVQFFPESGNLVNGLTSRVAFKAVAPDGLSVAISGKVFDSDSNQVASLTTLRAGMGSFLLRPLAGRTYTANVVFKDGTTESIKLPAPLDEGYVVNVYQPGKDSILIRIQASVGRQHSTVKLIVHSGGEIIFSSPVYLDGAMSSVWLDKRSFPSGIVQFTIFDNNNEPLNERIAFIKSNDRLQLAIKTPKTVYKSKEHVQLELNAKDSEGSPVAANFSVAVIDKNKAPVNEDAESTILSNILLTSDIKGYIEEPNYYFSTDTGDVNKALDNLMLTQAYRRFEWRTLGATVAAKPAFKAEQLGYTISGTVTSLTHQPLADARVLLLSMNARINKSTTTDASGRFKFDNLVFADSARFAVQARTKENNSNAILILDSIPAVLVSANANMADASIIKNNLQKAADEGLPIKLSGPHILKQVDIKALKNKENKKIITPEMFSLPDEQSADHIYTIPDPDSFVDLKSFIQARISNLRIETDNFGNSKVVDIRPVATDGTSNEIVIFVNGAHAFGDPLTDMNLEDIAKIEVVRNNQAIINMLRQGPSHPAGFLLIVTKPPSERKHYYPNIANIMPKGYNKVRQFYSPRYDRPADAGKPDLRSTIYWNPYVNTDENGKATLDFFNADGPGTYRVVVEGINAEGELGRQVYSFKVE